jgi:phage baseplate assembly protein W
MINHYYELPIKFKNLMKAGSELKTCDLRQSIAQNIFLIITTMYKENRYDESYGCAIWDLDFELVSNENLWLETIRKSIYESVLKHEKRLYEITVEIEVSMDEQVTTLKGDKTVKKRLTIYVRGYINLTGEAFSFNTNIYLSPLSLD